MLKEQALPQKLPLPKWCFVLLAVPTFYMPLAYLAMAVWVIIDLIANGRPHTLPQWLTLILLPAMVITLILLPLYAAWALFSKRLTWREKLGWLLIVVMANMIGMPIFYVFMLRRYLGLEGRIGERDEAALDAFLASCGISRDRLSEAQLNVLRSYCRTNRLERKFRNWSAIPILAIAAILLYFATVTIPRLGVAVFSNMIPTQCIVIDTAKNTRSELPGDTESKQSFVECVMVFGAMAGAAGMTSFLWLGLLMPRFLEDRQRKVIMDFLKADSTPLS